MAVDTRYFCDRCGERIFTDRSEFKPTVGPFRTSGRGRIDLCHECATGFLDWLGPECGRKPEPEPSEAAG